MTNGVVVRLGYKCWVITRDGSRPSDFSEDDPHVSPEHLAAELASARTDYPDADVGAEEEQEACASLACAGCGIDLGGEDEYPVTHWPANEIRQHADHARWEEFDGRWWCTSCALLNPRDVDATARPGPLDQPLF